MVTKENNIVNRLETVNLLAFYLEGMLSLFHLVQDHYQLSLFWLMLSLISLYTYFDIKEAQ